MRKDIFEKIASFLLGASWAVVLFGALVTFKVFLPFGFVFSLLLTLFYIFFSLILVLIIDMFMVQKQRLKEAQKQTKLLEKIYENTQK